MPALEYWWSVTTLLAFIAALLTSFTAAKKAETDAASKLAADTERTVQQQRGDRIEIANRALDAKADAAAKALAKANDQIDAITQIARESQAAIKKLSVLQQRLDAEPDTTKQRAIRDEAADVEKRRRRALISQLGQLYVLSHDGISPAMAAGLEWPADDWMNAELSKLGEKFTFHGSGNAYTLTDLP